MAKFNNREFSAIFAALILDEQGDAAGRDALLKSVAEANVPRSNQEVYAVGLAKEMQQVFAKGVDAHTDRSTAAALFTPQMLANGGVVRYLAGRLLSQHGQSDLACEYWKQSVLGNGLHAQVLAASDLRRRRRAAKHPN